MAGQLGWYWHETTGKELMEVLGMSLWRDLAGCAAMR